MNITNSITNKVFNPYRRLFFGLIRISLFFVYIANYEVVLEYVHPLLEMVGFGEDGVIGWGSFTILALLVWTFYMACVGGLHVISWKVGPLPSFDRKYFTWHGNGSGRNQYKSYENIHRMIDYRDSRINHMSREDGASLYMSTEAFVSRFSGTVQGDRMLGFVDSKLNHMSREDGLSYVQSLVKE